MNRTEAEFQVQRHYRAAEEWALVFVEQEARKILTKHTRLEEFIIAMGRFEFIWKDHSRYEWPKYANRLRDFIEKWDDELHLTGEPMRFTASGPVRKDW